MILLALALALACSAPSISLGDAPPGDTAEADPDTDTAETGETGDPDEDAAEEVEYQAFFDPGTMQELRLELTDDAIEALNRDPFTWQSGNIEINGTRMENIAVRIKGSSTLRYFDTKPSLKFKLNEYVPGQKYGGLERVTINNMADDYSQSKEWIDYQVFGLAGLNAPRANFAHLWLNGEDFGLYTNIEAMDDHWLSRRYADASGDLWEANDYSDFSTDGIPYWTIASGTGDVAGLWAVRDATHIESGDFYADLDTVVDMDQFLTFWAWTIAIGNPDGYPYVTNDAFIYADPADGRFDFSPWGMDEAWYDGMGWSSATTRLGAGCIADAGCRARLVAATQEAVTQYQAMDVLALAETGWALSEEVLIADPRREIALSDAVAYREYLAYTIVQWPETLLPQLQ